MRNSEIVNALLARRGYTQYEGNKDNLSSLMFFFLMDASFQIFDKDVAHQACGGRLKPLMRKMKDGYHLFFKDFYTAFNPDQIDFLHEKLDEYEKLLAPHFEIAKIAVQECANARPLDEQREMSSVWICNLLAADAQDFHGECWRTGGNQPLRNAYIDRVIKASKDYSRARFGEGPTITEKKFNRVQSSVKVIANKTVGWLLGDYYKEVGDDK